MSTRTSGALRSPPLVRVALGFLIAASALYVAHVTIGVGTPGSSFYDHWIYDAVIGGSALVCFARAARVELDRGAWLALGAALSLYFAGDVYWNVALASLSEPPYPSWADAGWLAYYLPAYIAIALLLRQRMGRVRVSEWLDGVIGVLAMAAVAAATVLQPVLNSSGGDAKSVATNLAYPVGDLVLLVFTIAAIAFLGWRPGRGWLILALGLALFAVSDSAYLLKVADGSYVEGGIIDAGWPVAACLLAIAAWQPMAPARARLMSPVTEQSVTGGFALLALGVLVLDLAHPVNFAGRALAVAAMIAIVLRLVIAAYESRLIERARNQQARTDELTGLANRRGFYAELGQQLTTLSASGETAALLLMDLDRFKEFNDSLGHGAGDQLLQAVGERLSSGLVPGASVARLGGDEFVVLLPPGTDGVDAKVEAAAIQRALAVPVELDGILCHASASIGIAVIPDHGDDRTTLLRRADIAMYRAKHRGTGIELFDDQHDEISRGDIELAGELRSAIQRGELVLYYQPKANLEGGAVDCVEALVRWQHPRLGLLPPDAFLPIGERHGLMRQITRAVVESALRQQAAWRASGLQLAVAVNLSGADLLDARFPDEVAGLLRRFGTPAGSLQFEITENAVMIDPARVLETLGQLGDLGITFALDDYGTGHSSLTYLKRLPVSELKIDRSFVMEMTSANDNAVIVRSTIDLARNLGMRVVAEGVETSEHWDQLAEYGCDTAQGYFLSRPLPAEELTTWLGLAAEELRKSA